MYIVSQSADRIVFERLVKVHINIKFNISGFQSVSENSFKSTYNTVNYPSQGRLFIYNQIGMRHFSLGNKCACAVAKCSMLKCLFTS